MLLEAKLTKKEVRIGNMAIASLVISLLVALAVIYRDIIRDLYFKPELEVTFSLDEPVSRVTTVAWPLGISHPSQWKSAFWPRLRIKNTGRSVAKRCEGILTEIRKPDGTLDKRYDPTTLRWAIAPISRGLEPLDITRSREVDLNIFTTFENESLAIFATHPDPRGIPLGLEPNDYWIHIVIYGDNFKPVERGYAVHWDGKNYREVDMKPMNDKPTSKTAWPWQTKQGK